jgi:general secretion pathway protein H
VKNRGFSLIEFMVVMVLFSLSIALITPSLSRFSKGVELKGAAKRISAILRYYRSEAIYKGRVYQVLFDSTMRVVKIQSTEFTEGEEEGGKKEENQPQMIYSLPEGIHMKEIEAENPLYSSDLPTIEFYPNGGSNGGSLLLDSQDRKGYRIKVHFLTGVVLIESV